MPSSPFVGTWLLVSLEARLPDGSIDYPLGPRATGLLMYDAAGNMSLQLASPDRPSFETGDPILGTPVEIRAAFEGYWAYFGRYTVDEREAIITHYVLSGSLPNLAGTKQVRAYVFDGPRLTLTAPPLPRGGQLIVASTVWNRLA